MMRRKELELAITKKILDLGPSAIKRHEVVRTDQAQGNSMD